MDKSYALQRNVFSILLIKTISLQGFDGNLTGTGPVTHYIYIFFRSLWLHSAIHTFVHNRYSPIFYNNNFFWDEKQIHHDQIGI